MTVGTLSERLGLACIAGSRGLDKRVKGCYIGDLLSRALVRVEEGNIWITVMGNVNAVAVGVRTQASCILLCDGAGLDPDAGARAEEHALPVLAGENPAFALAAEIHKLPTHT